MGEKSQNSKKPTMEIDFAELQDGSLVDLIQDPLDPSKSLLARYIHGTVQQLKEVRDGNRILTPVSREDPSHKHIRLPRGAEPFGGVSELFRHVGTLLNCCLDLEVDWIMLMAIYGLSTWFPEKIPAAPYLALVGPPSSGKTTAMRCLSLVCRRGLLTADVTSAGFYDVCERMRPTLLIDETLTAGHRPTLFHLLRSSNSPGFVSLRKNKARFAYGPKVLSWLEMPNDPALNSRCIIIPMQRTTRADLKSPNDPKTLQYAEKIQMGLQQFRFEYFKKLVPPRIPGNEKLSARMLDLYRALALPIGEHEELCACLAHLIANQRQFHRCLLSAPQASMARVLYGLIHTDHTNGGYWLRDLTRLMNADLASHNESAGLTERRSGELLTSLGLTFRTRMNAGYILWLDRVDRERVHRLAWDYEVDDVSPPSDTKCEFCTQAQTVAPQTDTPAVSVVRQAGSDRPKRKRVALRARRSFAGIRLPVAAPKRSHQT
jgi:hypothetical protein